MPPETDGRAGAGPPRRSGRWALGRSSSRRALEALERALPSVAAVVAALTLGGALIAATHGSLTEAWSAFGAMLWGGVGDWPRLLAGADAGVVLRPLGEAGNKAALLLFTGLAVGVAFRVGLFNIGAQGQLVVGAITAAAVGARLPLPAGLHLAVALAAAAAAGALYALGPALLKVRRGVHEVISTIMLNWVAVSLVESWLVVGPLRASAAVGQSVPGTDEVLASARLPLLVEGGSRLNLALPLAVVLALGVWTFFARFRRGFEWRVAGLSPEAARASGVPVERILVEAMAASGACAGLAGGVLILGTEGKYPATLAAPYGFDGIAMALLGQGHPLGIAGAALLFGVLRAGGTRLQLFGVHKSFPELLQGFALLFVAARPAWERLVGWRRGRANA